MKPIVEEITQQDIKEDRDHFKVGDEVRVHVRVREGDKERIQIFKGIVIVWVGMFVLQFTAGIIFALVMVLSSLF